jgi:hypothetical protein
MRWPGKREQGEQLMKLEWNRLPGYPGELATGQDWTYLITANDQETVVVLTRWEPQDNLLSTDVSIARQAALYAIYARAYGVVPGAGDAAVAHLRKLAQRYESGLDVAGEPAWHGYSAVTRS